MAYHRRRAEIRIVYRNSLKERGNYGKLCSSGVFREEFADICSYSPVGS